LIYEILDTAVFCFFPGKIVAPNPMLVQGAK